MLFARIDVDGSLVGLFNDPAVDHLPSGCTALTQAEYDAWASSPRSTYSAGVLSPPPPPAPPSVAQQAAAALAAGVAVVSTATPALNGTYAVDVQAQQRLTSVQTRINAGLPLPLGLSTITWIDMAGAPHAFSAAQFTSLAHAISDYVYQLDMVSMGQGSALPTASLTIA